jgi:hypothetical protein
MRRFGTIVCGLAIVYVLVYSALSAFGRYEPEIVDLRGVRLYAWSPLGFYDSTDGRWSTSMEVTFLPLWVFDARLIHARKWA